MGTGKQVDRDKETGRERGRRYEDSDAERHGGMT